MKNKEDFKKKLKTSKEYLALAVVDAKNYEKFNLELIKHMTEEVKVPGVYVTINKPYKSIEKKFKEKEIDTRVILFIDAVTKTEGGFERKNNCLFIGSPENLTDIFVAMDQAVRSFSGEKFLFFDSLNTLLLYNDVEVVAKFVQSLSGKMREWGIRGIIISLEKKGNKELINELVQFCDIHFGIGDKK